VSSLDSFLINTLSDSERSLVQFSFQSRNIIKQSKQTLAGEQSYTFYAAGSASKTALKLQTGYVMIHGENVIIKANT